MILEKLNKIDKRLDVIESDIKEIKLDISKIKKFVATDNADFDLLLRDKLYKTKQQ